MNKLTVGSLFAGIGGIDLGLERTNGFEIKWQVEIDEYCAKVLEKHWPNVTRFRDIRDCEKHNLPHVDVLTGGFPCQPHSFAGKRQASADERDLWGEFYRIICEIKPRYVVGENVLGLLSSERGHFFGGILRDLAQIGYDAEWFCLRASDFGSPHRRERIFIVAYPNGRHGDGRSKSFNGWTDGPGMGSEEILAYSSEQRLQREQWTQFEGTGIRSSNSNQDMAYPNNERCQECNTATSSTAERLNTRYVSTYRVFGQSQPCMGRDAHGISREMDGYHRWPSSPGMPQYDYEPPRTITEKLPHRIARLKALGNAVVPQIATYIGRCILEREAFIEKQHATI